jgi:Flp pilus assembly protein TadG
MIAAGRPRRGTTVVEAAVVVPVTIMILLAIIVGGFGVFRYQEVAELAREGARYAAVRGTRYAQYTGRPPATRDDVYQSAILPKVVILDPRQLTVDVSWVPDQRPGSFVTVTVRYQWISEAVFGSITLSSSATIPMAY